MKNIIFRLLPLFLLATSCQKSSIEGSDATTNRVSFSASSDLSTRSVDLKSSWSEGDYLGIFSDNLDNLMYTVSSISADGKATLTPTSPTEVTYPEDGTDITCYAYHPYSSSSDGGSYTIDLANNPIDLLISDIKTTSIDDAASGVEFNFSHALSYISLTMNLTSDEFEDDFASYNTSTDYSEYISVYLEGYSQGEVTMDESGFVASFTSEEPKSDESINFTISYTSEGIYTAEAIIMPNIYSDEAIIRFEFEYPSDDNNSKKIFYKKLSDIVDGGEAKSGYMYSSTATVGRDDVTFVTYKTLGWTNSSSGFSDATLYKGAGTEDDPYLIVTEDDLIELQTKAKNQSVTAYYKQIKDITIDNTTSEWSGIGSSTYPFSGLYDGNGCTISHSATANDETPTVSAIFNFTDGATIKNLTIEGDIYTKCIVYGGYFYGSIASIIQNSTTIDNCVNNSSFSNSTIDDTQHYSLAGIAGADYDNSCIINRCVNNGDITNTNISDKYYYTTGIAGTCKNVFDCANYGNITGNGYTSGIVGFGANVVNCHNRGSILDSRGYSNTYNYAYANGISFEISITIKNCYNRGVISSENNVKYITGFITTGSENINNCYYLDFENSNYVDNNNTLSTLSTDAYLLTSLNNYIETVASDYSSYEFSSWKIEGADISPILDFEEPTVIND